MTPVQGVTKLVILDFEITQGPQVRIQHVDLRRRQGLHRTASSKAR